MGLMSSLCALLNIYAMFADDDSTVHVTACTRASND